MHRSQGGFEDGLCASLVVVVVVRERSHLGVTWESE